MATPAQNEKHVLDYLDAIRTGDHARAFEAFHEDATWTTPPTLPWPGHFRGRKAIFEEYFAVDKGLFTSGVSHYDLENLNVVKEYAKDWLGGSDVAAEEEIVPGEGAVMRRGLSKVAIYRDERGVCHEHSALCPHLGCIVHWNGAEKTWDCPCHGSRFDALGRVIVGPANSPLAEVEHHEHAEAR